MRTLLALSICTTLAICSVAQPASAQTGACVYAPFTFPFVPQCAEITEAECDARIGWYLGDGTTCDDDVEPFHPYSYDKDPLNFANAGQVNISGASLFVDYFSYPAVTNDCSDVDGDTLPCNSDPFVGFVNGTCGIYGVDQLAPDWDCGTWNGHWLVQYRSVGSGNGLAEFVDYQLLGILPNSIPSEKGIINRTTWANTGSKTWPCGQGVEANCYPLPNTADLNCDGKVNGEDIQAMVVAIIEGEAAYEAAYPDCVGLYLRADYDESLAVDMDDVPGLVSCALTLGCGRTESGTPVCPQTIDIANMDVATKWFVLAGSSGNAAWNRKPTQDGYGTNPTAASGTTQGNKLKGLSRPHPFIPNETITLNTNTDNPDARTVFDTTIAASPAAIIANRGAALENVRFSELQYLFVTGRMPSGENLIACTRDSGSGTRNLTMNSLGIDPSWGVGENVGKKFDDARWAQLGPLTQPSPYVQGCQPTNCGGSSIMEGAVQNQRLAVGYTGAFGASRAIVDAASGRYEILNVMKDVAGGTQYVRLSVDACLDNADVNTGYQINGSQTLATIGDPESGRVGHEGAPAMARLAPRDLILNIIDSLITWEGNPSGSETLFCPAGILVNYYIPEAAADAIPPLTDPTDYTQGNPKFNQAAQDAVRIAQQTVVPGFGTVNAAGKVPVRLTDGAPYDDGSTDGKYLGCPAGTWISGGGNLWACMQVQGDFNMDGVRNINDICAMMVAYYLQRDGDGDYTAFACHHQAGTWPQALLDCCPDLPASPGDGTYIIPAILGDFDGDGNFTLEDIRFFADGLALDPTSGLLDRAAGFEAVDEAWNCLTGNDNFFNTVVNGTYLAGDARFDVAGEIVYRGAYPRGADGFVTAADVDYVNGNQFSTPWGSDLGEHALKDLSCDMDGDLDVDAADAASVAAKAL